MRTFIPILFVLVTTPSQAAIESCSTTKEFVTTFEFLKQDEEFKVKDAEAQPIALEVASGCTGAAKRFIRISKTLTRSGATNKNAIQTALPFAAATDTEAETFVAVFRRAIAEDSLDLELGDALKIALKLSKNFSGDQKRVREDFDRIADFCADSTKMGLPRLQCGEFAAEVASQGEKYEEGVSKSFFALFEYLKSESGPQLTTADALQLSKKLAARGPMSYDNFKQAYQYASSEKGLKLARADAIQFAKKISELEKASTNAVKTSGSAVSPAKK